MTMGILPFPLTPVAPTIPGVFGGHAIHRVGIVHVGIVLPNPGEVVHIYIHLFRGPTGILYAQMTAGPVMPLLRY
jgi:hypothetical protein